MEALAAPEHGRHGLLRLALTSNFNAGAPAIAALGAGRFCGLQQLMLSGFSLHDSDLAPLMALPLQRLDCICCGEETAVTRDGLLTLREAVLQKHGECLEFVGPVPVPGDYSSVEDYEESSDGDNSAAADMSDDE